MKQASRSVIAAVLAVLAPCAASAAVFTLHLKTDDRVPIVGHAVTFYLQAPYTLLDTQVTDAAGDVTLTDNVAGGTSRCFSIAIKPNWKFVGSGGIDRPEDHDVTGVPPTMCSTAADLGNYAFYWGRLTIPHTSVIGGVKGYVNPNLNETAKIVFQAVTGGTVTAKIYSSHGKLLVTKEKAVAAGFQHQIEWDGRNGDGKKVASGIYIAHVTGAGVDSKVKIAIIWN